MIFCYGNYKIENQLKQAPSVLSTDSHLAKDLRGRQFSWLKDLIISHCCDLPVSSQQNVSGNFPPPKRREKDPAVVEIIFRLGEGKRF